MSLILSAPRMSILQKHQQLFSVSAVIIACVMLAGMDAIGKYLQQSLPALQVVWGRYFFHFLLFIIAALILHKQRQLLHPKRPVLQFIRGVLLLGVTINFYIAIREVSLADASAVLFTSPVLVTLFAALLLKEHLSRKKMAAVMLGFIGVLIIIQPGSAVFNPKILLAAVSAASLAGYFILTRYLSRHDHVITTIFYSPVAGTLILSIMLPWVWVMPDWQEFLWLFSMGVIGAAGHYLLTWAFHHADASLLSPLLNSQLVAAAFFSAWIFSDQLDIMFYLGTALIIIASMLVSRPPRRKTDTL